MLQAAGLEEADSPREDLTRAVTELFETLARRRPLVLIFEDVHWAEAPLLDLVEHLLEHIGAAPLMLLCVARDDLLERRPQWRVETPMSSTLELEPLSAPDTRALVRSLLPAAEAGDQLDERLAERAEGNPLFAEQLVALLREDGDVSLPPTIQALLAARLDRLPPAERAAIGAASVVGREFWGDAVGALLPDQDEQGVRELLTTLAAQAAGHAGGVDARVRGGLLVHATCWSATPPTRRSRSRTAPTCTSGSRTGSSAATRSG